MSEIKRVAVAVLPIWVLILFLIMFGEPIARWLTQPTTRELPYCPPDPRECG